MHRPRALTATDASLVVTAGGGGAMGGVWRSLTITRAVCVGFRNGSLRGFLVPRYLVSGMGLSLGQVLGRQVSVDPVTGAMGLVWNESSLGLAWRLALLWLLLLLMGRIAFGG